MRTDAYTSRCVCVHVTASQALLQNISEWRLKSREDVALVVPPNCLVWRGWAPGVSSAGFHSLWTCRKECGTFPAAPVPSAPAHQTDRDKAKWENDDRHYEQRRNIVHLFRALRGRSTQCKHMIAVSFIQHTHSHVRIHLELFWW